MHNSRAGDYRATLIPAHSSLGTSGHTNYPGSPKPAHSPAAHFSLVRIACVWLSRSPLCYKERKQWMRSSFLAHLLHLQEQQGSFRAQTGQMFTTLHQAGWTRNWVSASFNDIWMSLLPQHSKIISCPSILCQGKKQQSYGGLFLTFRGRTIWIRLEELTVWIH